MKNDVSKKRKKTSKEKRVLVASLGIAAVVAAGSTFAWFTSQDEVTNRLSANAAYDVSVIETFTPPTNWIPGQKVNKDTAAVNTGNIPAFVKQKLEGKMQVTLQQAEKEFNLNRTDGVKYVELTEDEVDVVEAGGYLAWASNGATQIGIPKGGAEATADQCYLGEVSAVHSGENIEEGDFGSDIQFAPPATGDYIFRRVIDVIQNDDGTTTEKYEYKGYHFDADSGKYYQIKVINGLQTGENGILQAAPIVYYGAEKHDVRNLPLRYEAAAIKNYLLYTPVGSNEVNRVEYLSKTENVAGDDDSVFTRYVGDNGSGGKKDYFVCMSKGTSSAIVGCVYTGALPIGELIGSTSGDVSKYDITIDTPDRLIATYEVGKSDDVFIGTPTELSDFTADNYDAKLAAIAYSDYLLAKVAYENEKAQYELNKKAYETGTALLDALAKNEEILAKKQKDIKDNAIDKFTSTLNSNLAFSGDATGAYTTQVTAVNDKLGTLSTTNQIPSVDDFIDAVNTYKANPTDVNWEAVVTAYDAVEEAFTGANKAITKLEDTIVTAWNEAALHSDVSTKLTDVANALLPAEASPNAVKAKAAANQLITWETELAKYQNSVSAYYASLSAIQDKDAYKLLDVRSLENAYKDAVIKTVKKKGTNAVFDGSGVQQNLATTETPLGETIGVQEAYKIKADTTVKNALNLNPDKNIPIKNSISNDGFAGDAEITGITGTKQFTIGGNAIAAQTDDNKPSETDVNTLATAYEEAKKTNDKYQTNHTNQHANDDIVIYINLKNIGDGSEVDQWKLSPTLVPGAEEANFYYTSILGGGETSSILVDSLELSGDTTNVAFKEFDFDLNVTVDSAQVVVSEDGRFYESTAVNANPEFISKPSKPHYMKETSKPVKADVKVDWN